MTVEVDDRFVGLGLAVDAIREDQLRLLRALSYLNELRDVPANSKHTGFQSSVQVKHGPGVLYSVDGFNNNGGTRFIQLIDEENLPPDGYPVGLPVIAVATVVGFSRDFGAKGLRFDNGLWIVTSSTVNTKTIGAVDMLVSARFA